MAQRSRESGSRPLAMLIGEEERYYAPLLTAMDRFGVKNPLWLARPGTRFTEALQGLLPLGFIGAFLGGAPFETEAIPLLDQMDPEVRTAGRVDVIETSLAGLQGGFVRPMALGRLLERYGMTGGRAVWVGQGHGEMLPGARSLTRIDVVAGDRPSGEALLAKLPTLQRGRVAVGRSEAEVLGREVDLILYAGGRLERAVLQPYHTLVSLAPITREAYRYVEHAVDSRELDQTYLSLVLERLLGVTLPSESFLFD